MPDLEWSQVGEKVLLRTLSVEVFNLIMGPWLLKSYFVVEAHPLGLMRCNYALSRMCWTWNDLKSVIRPYQGPFLWESNRPRPSAYSLDYIQITCCCITNEKARADSARVEWPNVAEKAFSRALFVGLRLTTTVSFNLWIILNHLSDKQTSSFG